MGLRFLQLPQKYWQYKPMIRIPMSVHTHECRTLPGWTARERGWHLEASERVFIFQSVNTNQLSLVVPPSSHHHPAAVSPRVCLTPCVCYHHSPHSIVHFLHFWCVCTSSLLANPLSRIFTSICTVVHNSVVGRGNSFLFLVIPVFYTPVLSSQ